MDFKYNQQLIWVIRAIILVAGGYFLLTRGWFLPPEIYVKEDAEPQEIQLLGWIPYWDQKNSFEFFEPRKSVDFRGIGGRTFLRIMLIFYNIYSSKS